MKSLYLSMSVPNERTCISILEHQWEKTNLLESILRITTSMKAFDLKTSYLSLENVHHTEFTLKRTEDA